MSDSDSELIDVARLRIGHFVFLDLGWLSHPFPLNSFRIQTLEQIDAIRALGIDRIRYSPERSSPEAPAELTDDAAPAPAATTPEAADDGGTAAAGERTRRALLAAQRERLQACEREFDYASRSFRQITESVRSQPAIAREASLALVSRITEQLVGAHETCIRLLSEMVGERACHEINVTVVSMLLAKACELDADVLPEVGLGALLHDIGKLDLPDRLRYENEPKTAAERQCRQQHVAFGVARAKQMELPRAVLRIIAQHHEHADGSGYPARITNERMTPGARIVALVNRYDNLCNPGNPALALTPHETLSQLFAHARDHFDAALVNAVVRMMGVYPPGSVIQLSDGRYALVVSVNPQRPLKPSVIVHDADVPRDEALIVDLGEQPALGIRRSLRPAQLPRATIDYLSPRTRICYFFERARGTGDEAALP